MVQKWPGSVLFVEVSTPSPIGHVTTKQHTTFLARNLLISLMRKWNSTEGII